MGQERQAALGETVSLSPEAAARDLAASAGDDGAPRLAREALDLRLAQLGHQRPALAGGRYELRGIEGLGATSRVYRVFDRDLAREVAIKVLARSAPGDAEDVASFIDEARITAELQHPNVLPVYELDAGERGELFFSMKRIEGRSLGDALMAAADGHPDPRFAGAGAANAIVSVFIDVCQALSYAHHHGVIHQDVKPDNIMLGGFGEVLLVDWGSAVRVDQAEPRIYGTPLYMSPEQSRRERPTPASDVFCLGASLFHALAGRPPTAADSFEDLVRRRGAGEIDPPTALERALAPPALLHVALKALALAPADRYAGADAMLADLRAYQAGLAVSAYPEPPWRRAWRWYLLHRRACWAMAAAAALVAALVVALALEQAKRRASWALVADDDFAAITPEQLAKDWIGRVKISDVDRSQFRDEVVGEGRHWRLEGGRLHGGADMDYSDLVWRPGGLGGDLRVEWDATPEVTPLNLNCFIGADRESGYTFHIGTGDPRRAQLTRGARFEVCDQRQLDEPLRVGRTYAFTLERVGQRLRLGIDGKTVFDLIDDDPLSSLRSDTFGIDCFRDNVQAIGRIRVFERPLPELVSPLEVAQALWRNGEAAAAARQYAEIERVHRGTPLELTALAARGICLIRGLDKPAGDRLLRDFVAAHPDHQLAALCAVERESYARSQHADTEVARLRQELTRWRGQPILRRVLLEIGEDSRLLLAPVKSPELGGNPLDDERLRQVSAAVADFRRWGEAYGSTVLGSSFIEDATDLLRQAGRFDEVLAACPPGSYGHGCALLAIGDYERVLADYGNHPRLRKLALINLARWEQIAADPEADAEDRASALVGLGRSDEALARYPTTAAGSGVLLTHKRFDEFARLFAGHERDQEKTGAHGTPRARLMTARGQWEEILADYGQDTIMRWDALFNLDRREEALRVYPDVGWAVVAIACRDLASSERERGLEIIRKGIYPHRPNADADPDCFLMLMRGVWPMLIDGARPDPAAAEVAVLAGDRRWFGQRLWHDAAMVAGTEDEAAFRAQPRKLHLEHDLHLCRAVRAELLGRRDEALAEYRVAKARPSILSDGPYVDWRLAELAPKAPDAP
jgi:serine/threonine-protein kinase